MIEIGPQPCQFFWIAQISGLRDFIIGAGENSIDIVCAVIAGIIWPQRFGPFICFIRRVVGLHLSVLIQLNIGIVAVQIIRVASFQLFHGAAHLLFIGTIIFAGPLIIGRVFRVLLVLIVPVIGIARVFPHCEVPDHVAHCFCKRGLIFNLRSELFDWVRRLGFHLLAPEVGDRLGRRGQGAPRQALAQDELNSQG